ncbi:MAG TPA: gamma-glutamyltransferase family protein [Blastocatellia bacterium]|nr:gamma-glutamyltransferase family protein [Blastocatellia bacterium]HMX24903.1 gamma-glutamyltransferase family protein [Blastocatellia bacterium]HMY70958.1 gamma-glutamyltransferase family protein [Blastocatellia bacterium]HMZ16318.1 gamma-glutamyltransferase family protein [Blastocatellia bacterium]HNG28883.1 gamma-glutamyltransferase family protein [Blastocatellia bacterium]
MNSRTLARLVIFAVALSVMVSTSAQTPTYRPPVRGTRGVVAGGQPLVAEAGLRMLHRGGNAVDAGVAATLAGSVIEFSHFAFGGEVPVIIKMANKPQVVTINGQGQAPALATIEFFEKQRKDSSQPALIPSTGPTAATVPGVLDAMVVALQNYGTMKLADVMQPAIELADGFPIDELRVQYIKNTRPAYEQWKDTTDIFLPGGQVPKVGDIFVQKNLAKTLRELVDVEKKNARRGRVAALEAVRDYFYRGPLGKRYCDAIEKAGGLMRAGDLAAFHADIDQPTKVSFHGYDVYKVGFWSQGPVMLQILNILESYDLKAMKHNSPDYVHTLTEAIKLGFADRDRYYADPRFVKVPGAELLSKEYAEVRRSLIDPKSASQTQQPGDPVNKKSLAQLISLNPEPVEIPVSERAHDTTCVNVIDAAGNVFSATPSGAWLPSFVAGDTGIPISSRLQSALLIRGHANELKPGKRPRITLTPTLVMKDGQPFAALSTPGGDNQDQALVQVLLNVIEFGMNPQEAVEAARFETQHFVSSFSDHKFNPGSLIVEKRFGEALIEEMKRRGHKVEVNADFAPTSAPTIVLFDPKTKLIQAGADARRGRYAMGW